MKNICKLAALSVAFVIGVGHGFADDELVSDGNFESSKIPATWSPFGRASISSEGDNRFLHCGGPSSGASIELRLLPDARKVKLSVKMKTNNVDAGSANWQDARIAVSFLDGNGKRTGAWPSVIRKTGTNSWESLFKIYDVPSGAVAMKLTAANFGVSGSVSYDDISVRPVVAKKVKVVEGEMAAGGSFESGTISAPWKRFGRADVASDGENSYLSCQGTSSGASCDIPIKEGLASIKLKARMRTENIKAGAQNWQDARLAVSFHDKDGKRVGPWAKVFNLQGTNEWKSFEHLYSVPENSSFLRLTAANFGVSGKAFFDDISVVKGE